MMYLLSETEATTGEVDHLSRYALTIDDIGDRVGFSGVQCALKRIL